MKEKDFYSIRDRSEYGMAFLYETININESLPVRCREGPLAINK